MYTYWDLFNLVGLNYNDPNSSISSVVSNYDIYVGERYPILYNVSPSDANVTFTSSDSSVFEVDNGYIVGVAPGLADLIGSIEGTITQFSVPVVVHPGTNPNPPGGGGSTTSCNCITMDNNGRVFLIDVIKTATEDLHITNDILKEYNFDFDFDVGDLNANFNLFMDTFGSRINFDNLGNLELNDFDFTGQLAGAFSYMSNLYDLYFTKASYFQVIFILPLVIAIILGLVGVFL